jgi:putative hemolysin
MTHSSSLFAAAVLLACACGSNGSPPPGPVPPAVEPAGAAPGAAGIANPASVNCEERGGTLELREEPAGTVGICVFDDGSRCEEWRYFRGECAPGACRAPDGRCQAAP